MPDSPAPLQPGDTVTLVHIGGRTMEVTFGGVFGTKFDQAYVRWGLAGQYRVNAATGQLALKKVSVWSVCPRDLQRIRATTEAHTDDAKQRMRRERYGQ